MPYFDYKDARIHYEEHGEGDPLLLMHGFTQSARELRPLIDALAPHYHVIAPDFRGSGRSEPRPRTYTPRFYYEDAEDMAALLNYLNTGPTHILGFSDGGEVSLIMAIEHPELARTAVLWGAAGTLGNGDLAPFLDNIYNVVDNPIPDQRGWSKWLRKAYGEEAARGMTQSWASASKAIMAAGSDISLSRAHEIRCPVLVLAGEHDPFCPPDLARELVSRMPNAQFIPVPKAGHAIHEERERWFTRTVLDWLAQH